MSGLADHVVMWRPNGAGRWEVQPHLWPKSAAYALCNRLVDKFGGESWTAQLDAPTRFAVVRQVTSDLEESGCTTPSTPS